jgi:DNA-binding MarR family transcriptional regulator
MPPFKFDKIELKIAKVLARRDGITVSEVGQALGLHASQVSKAVNSLAEKGILNTSRLGLFKKVRFSDTKHAELLRRITVELAHLDPEKILASSYLEVLSCLSSMKADTKDILSETGLAERTVRPILKELRQRGIVLKEKDGILQIGDRFPLIKEFAMEYRRYCNQKKALEQYSDAILLWEQNREFIIRSSEAEERDGFLWTGISAFHKYGIQLFAPDFYYYFHSPRKGALRLEDIIVHVFLTEPPSPRILLAALLLWKKNEKSIDADYLTSISDRHGKLQIIRSIERYLNTEGKERSEGFPKWGEFTSKAKEYGL